MRVLLVAPEVEGLPKLSSWKEADQIGDMPGVTLSILAGKNVTRSRVVTRLKQPYDVVIFAGHGKPGKFIVSDGCLTAQWLAQYVKGAAPDVVLLSSCNSAGHSKRTLTSLAQEINREGFSVIAMPTAVDDDGAAVFDVEFVRAYSTGASLRDAHGIGQEQMEALTDSRQIPHFWPGQNVIMARTEERMMERFDGLDHQIGKMVLRQDRTWAELVDLTGRMGSVETKLETLINGGARA